MQIHLDARSGDTAGLQSELDAGVWVDLRDEQGLTPLMHAVSSEESSGAAVRLLLERGADPNAVCGDAKSVLTYAVHEGDPARVEALLDVGADIGHVEKSGYDVLTNAMFGRHLARDERLMPLIDLLIRRGAPLRGESDHGESALSVTSREGRFDVVARLLEAGADASVLEWTPLMHAIATGTLAELKAQLPGADLLARDRWSRTPWLLAVATGDVAKAQLLLDAGADLSDVGRCGKVALMIPAEFGRTPMLRFLLDLGLDVDATDEFGDTALLEAAQADNFEAVQLLVEAGAKLTSGKRDQKEIIGETSSLEIIRFLLGRGGDWNEVEESVRAEVLGLFWGDEIDASPDDYHAGKHRHFGTRNPEPMPEPFWRAMVRCGWGAYAAREHFDDLAAHEEDASEESEPVWCYVRFGKSFTELPDGRFIEIGGEHEDFYDPDFCIYNEVFVHDGQGNFEIFGYPEDVFPPTDFHSATLVDGHIFIIGCMGYDSQRVFGHTPVYRLNIETLSIEPVETSGDSPGWICRHQAILRGNEIHITGAQTWRGDEDNDRGPQADALEDEELDELPQSDFEEELDGEDGEGELGEVDIQSLMDRLDEEDAAPVEPTSTFILNLNTLVWREVPPEQPLD